MVCCKECKYLINRGGLWICTCTLAVNGTVSLDFKDSCNYFKQK